MIVHKPALTVALRSQEPYINENNRFKSVERLAAKLGVEPLDLLR